MANFFLDNQDIQFLFDHIDLEEIADIQEEDTRNGDADYVPVDAADTVDGYRRVLDIVGQIAGETIEPSAEQIDREGNTLNDDGTVTLHPLVQANLDRMSQADLMGFTLPRQYGGLGLSYHDTVLVVEEMAKVCGVTGRIVVEGNMGAISTIMKYGNEAQKELAASYVLAGDKPAICITEPGSVKTSTPMRAPSCFRTRGC